MSIPSSGESRLGSTVVPNGAADVGRAEVSSRTGATNAFESRVEPLNVLVVVDRPDRARGEFWRECLSRELPGGRPTRVICRSVASDVVQSLQAQQASTLECLQNADVCVVNWDAGNDDPDFGADLTRRWFQHRHLAVLDWVYRGGILIIEGQANLGVPTQQAYDAMVGRRELLVCGPEDALDARKQELRVGRECRLTRRARASRLFGLLPRTLTATGDRDHDQMFPPHGAGKLVARFLRRGQWPLLYRGWFRRQPLRRRRLAWVPLAVTAGRRFNHPTLMAARSGTGAVFASTMMLASSRQFGLIEAMLDTHGQAALLPTPWRFTTWLSSHKSNVFLPVVVALSLGAASSQVPLRNLFHDQDSPWQDFWKALLTVSIIAVSAALPWAARRLARFVRDAVGA